MNEIERIVDQLERAWKGPAWHGASVQELLEGVDEVAAARRPIPGGQTIWEVAEHIVVWDDVVRRRIGGETLQPTGDLDWPPVRETTPAAWERTRERMAATHDGLRAAIASFPETRLDELRPGADSWYVLFHGVVQHDLYHAGQIGLLKKAGR